jgi:hypothetical protein
VADRWDLEYSQVEALITASSNGILKILQQFTDRQVEPAKGDLEKHTELPVLYRAQGVISGFRRLWFEIENVIKEFRE